MKRLALGLVIVAAGCGKKDDDKQAPRPAPADAAAAAAPTDAAAPAAAADPGKRFEECVAAFNARDVDRLRGCYAADAVGNLPDSPPEMKGADEILAANQAFWKAFPDTRLEPQVILVKGRTVAALLLGRGTQSGPLATPGGELPPTGAVTGTLGFALVDYDDAGRAVRETQYWDSGQLMRQLARSAGARAPITAGTAEPARATVADPGAQADTAQRAEQLVAAFNSRDWKALAAGLDPKVVVHDMARPEDQNGAAAVVAGGKQLVQAASDAHLAVKSAWSAGDYVFIEVELTGKNDGSWPPLTSKGTGKPFTLHTAQLIRFAGGKPVEIWRVGNGIALMQQLGVAPPTVQPPR